MFKLTNFILLFTILNLLKDVKSLAFLDLLRSYGLTTTYDIKTIPLPTLEEYDFIIVGAGTAGSVVANRLSENKRWKILLLEAGKPEGILNQIPILYANFHLTDYNWGYRVERQKNACFGMVDGRCPWPRGKSLGGTSTINAMLHTRGNKLDYDIWASLGNKGWSYDDVLKYYRKSEKLKISEPYNASYHGTDGYVCVEDIPYRTPLASTFLEAGKKLGWSIVEYNGAHQIGFSYLQVNMDRGTRCSASRAYLQVKRPNLDIVTHALVTRILIDNNKRAYGVEYIKHGITRRVKASKEVISSAGTIDSAKLLMLSGIGPREHLIELGIDVIKDSKVGYNLYEHIGFLGLAFTINASIALTEETLLTPVNAIKYLKYRNGPFALPGGPEAIAFLQTKYATDSRPDVELLFIAGSVHSDSGVAIRKSYGVTDEVYNKVFRPLEGRHAWSIWPIVQQPRSYGRITLKSKNPYHTPILEPNLFSHPADVEIVLEGIKYSIALASTDPFQKYNSQLHDIKMPGCESHQFASDDYWRCAIRTLPAIENHEIGTAKMGPSTDPYAVVDPELRVYGIKGLRVIDASIMPTMPVGHINAGVYMIGEKGADMVKQEWSDCGTF